MKVSVIIPTYKPSSYIEKCLDSIFSQTLSHADFEIIIILNGDKEPYWTQLNRYVSQNTDISISLLYSEIEGVSVARNIGLDNAKGEYICFVDDDDIVTPPYLQSLLDNASSDTLALSNVLAFEDCSNKLRPLYITEEFVANAKHLKAINVRRYLYSSWAKLIHRNIIGCHRFDTRLRNGEDAQFMLLISDKIKWYNFTNEDAQYQYRQREGSAFNRNNSIGCNVYNMTYRIVIAARIYCSHPGSYSCRLFFTYFCATIMGGMRQILHIKQ